MKSSAPLPRSRRDGLLVRELSNETLVYNLDRHEALCLNQTSALVWRHCDGKTSAQEVSQSLHEELQVAVDPDIVWLAVKQLRRFHLVEGLKELPSVSRRKLLLKYAPAALALPLIMSIAAPAAAQAASRCGKQGDPCDQTRPCCPGFNCDGICFAD